MQNRFRSLAAFLLAVSALLYLAGCRNLFETEGSPAETGALIVNIGSPTAAVLNLACFER